MRFCALSLLLLGVLPAQSGAAPTGLPAPRPLPIASTYGRIHWVSYQITDDSRPPRPPLP